MQVPDYVVNPGAGVPADAATLSAQTITVAAEAMIALVQHATVAALDDDGALLTGDLLLSRMRDFGTRPVGRDLACVGPPTFGWQAELSSTDDLGITMPDGAVLYTGTMPAYSDWRRRAVATHATHGGVVVVTGIRGTIEDLAATVLEERACWVRVPLLQHA
ncbi:hypothetical protein [Nocardia sp. CNY236]|uniref:hypothetical protein n=1 Tax=Nocardia sp. CNY236 TaxID=1169152 RepID=UPI000411B905|nr:hypothetical protein [Nocardia sp. CNY236]